MYNNKRFWFRKGIFFFLLFVAGILLFTLVVMQLWNAILVPVLHISAITFGQALGIFILSKILFGGFRRGWGGRGGYGMPSMHQKFANTTPKEREKFKAEWRNRCNRWGMKEPVSTPDNTSQH